MPPIAPQDRKTAKKTTTPRKRAAVRPETPPPADPNSKYAPTTWGSSGGGGAEELTVPSGQLCLVTRPGVQGLITMGVLNNLDSLTQLVDEKHVKRVKGKSEPEIDVQALMSDQEKMTELFHVVDRVICHVVQQPPIHMAPNDPTRRQNGVIYADMVDIEDKMFIFQFAVGGTRGFETFRGQLSEAMGGVDAQQGVAEDAS